MTCKEAALMYLTEYGFSVIPVRKDKVALVPWKEFTQRKPTEEEIEEWWTRYPDAQVAIITGSISGIAVLDDDDPKALEGLHLPATPCAMAFRGPHYYFKNPGEPVHNRIGIVKGIDLKGDGGYVVAPPSVNEQGHQYTWAISLDEEELADLPDWCLEKARIESVIQEEAEEIEEKIAEGERNQALTSLGGTFRRRGLSGGEIEAILCEINKRRCNPPLPESEVLTIAKSVSRYRPDIPLVSGKNGSKNGGKEENGNGENGPRCLYRTFDMIQDHGLVFAVKNSDHDAVFMTPEGHTMDYIMSDGAIIRPPYGDEVRKGLIQYLDELDTYSTIDDLIAELKDFFNAYFEASEEEHYDLMAFFAITAWFSPVLPAVPILAFESGSSKGKTRGAELVWSVGPYPYRSSGTKFASWVRTVDKYHISTLFINEADMNNSEESQELAKFYNVRPLRSEAVIQRMSEGGKNTYSFFVFGPTVITLRQPIQDDAVERRMIKIHPQSLTRKDIPFNLPKEANDYAKKLRSKLAMMASLLVPEYQHKNYTPGDFADRRVEPRLVQLCEGTLNIASMIGKQEYFISLLEKLSSEQKEGFSYSRDALIMRGYFGYALYSPEVLQEGVKPHDIALRIEEEFGVRLKDSTIGRRGPSLGFVRTGRKLLLPPKLLELRMGEYLPKDEYDKAVKLLQKEALVEVPF